MNKTFLKSVVAVLILFVGWVIIFMPSITHAQLTVPQGGTGTTTFQAGTVLFASSSPLRITSNSNFLWTNSNSTLDIIRNSNTSNLRLQSGGGQGGNFYFYTTDGSITSPSSLANNNSIGTFYFYGFDGFDYAEFARIQASVDGTPGEGDDPGRLTFYTTQAGNNVLRERMRIDNAGRIGIGTTSPYAKLSVVGPVVSEYIHATSTTAVSRIENKLIAGNTSTRIGIIGNTGTACAGYFFTPGGVGPNVCIGASEQGVIATTSAYTIKFPDVDAGIGFWALDSSNGNRVDIANSTRALTVTVPPMVAVPVTLAVPAYMAPDALIAVVEA